MRHKMSSVKGAEGDATRWIVGGHACTQSDQLKY